MKYVSVLFIGAFLLISASDLYAQKFGYINSAQLLSEHPDIKVADSELESLQTQYSTRIENKVKELQAKYTELANKEQAGTIPPKDLQEQVKKLKEQEQSLLTEEQQLQKDLLTKREQLYQPIVDKINNAIKAVALENNYQYIFDQTQGVLLYTDESADVSQLIKSKLGI